MADNSRPVYQHRRAIPSGAGAPLPGQIQEGEIALNLGSRDVFTSRPNPTPWPNPAKPADQLSDSDYVWRDLWSNGNPTTRIGAALNLYSTTSLSAPLNPADAQYAYITLTAPKNATVNGRPALPAQFKILLNGGVDSELSLQVLGSAATGPNRQVLTFTNPMTLRDQGSVPGLMSKIRYLVSNQYVVPHADIGGRNTLDSDYPNSTGWRVEIDDTGFGEGYPDSGRVLIWYADSDSVFTKPMTVSADASFIANISNNIGSIDGIIQSSRQALPVGFPFYAGRATTLNNPQVGLFYDATPLGTFTINETGRPAPLFNRSNNAFYTTNITNSGALSNVLLIDGNTSSLTAQALLPGQRRLMRLLTSSDSDVSIIKLNSRPFINFEPPAFGLNSEALQPETGDIWIDNAPSTTQSAAAFAGQYSWYDDTLSQNAWTQQFVANKFDSEIQKTFPAQSLNAQFIRNVMLNGYDSDAFGPSYPARNLVTNDSDGAVLNKIAHWSEWRTVPSVSYLDPYRDQRAYVPDYGLRSNPLGLSAYQQFTNPDGLSRDAWKDFITFLNPNTTGSIATREFAYYVGGPTTPSPQGPYYATSEVALAADVYVNGVRLQQGQDYTFVSPGGRVYPVTTPTGWTPLPTDQVTVVFWTGSYRESVNTRTQITYVWGVNAFSDSDVAITNTSGVLANPIYTDVYVNGVRLSSQTTPAAPADYTYRPLPNGDDYYIDFVVNPGAGDLITIIGIAPQPITFLTNKRRVFRFTLPMDSDIASAITVSPYVYDGEGLSVLLNGVELEQEGGALNVPPLYDYTYTTSYDPQLGTTSTTVIPTPELFAILTSKNNPVPPNRVNTLKIITFGTAD